MKTSGTVHLAAAIACCAGMTQSLAAVCVNPNDAADLQTKISAAEGSTSMTSIQVPRGTYHLNGNPLVFSSLAAGQGQFDIAGGYNSDCSAHINNPALTIIDGDNLSGVLSLSSTAGVSVRYLTLQNGLKAQNTGLLVAVSGGGVIVDYNIIRNNRATDERAGLSVSVNGSGDIHFDGNLIVGNSANSNVSGGEIDNLGTGNTYLTNNTIANNTITGTSFNYGGLFVYGGAAPQVSNNIFWGDTTTDFYSSNHPLLTDNDCQAIGGNQDASSTGNLSVDPQFSGPGDFHLQPTSPLLGAGTLTPPGNLPTIDIEGLARSYNGFVDMGAYERGNEIFENGFNN